jgi:predicted GIY-YIG superfamily endonuclease
MIGRLYRIDGGGKFYIGSTTQDLKKRLKNHRSKSKEENRKTTPLYTHFNNIGWEHAVITTIRVVIITEKKQLLEEEDVLVRQCIINENCLNQIPVIVTREQRRENNRIYRAARRLETGSEDRERVKQWRIDNPEKWREQTARYRQKCMERKAVVNN